MRTLYFVASVLFGFAGVIFLGVGIWQSSFSEVGVGVFALLAAAANWRQTKPRCRR